MADASEIRMNPITLSFLDEIEAEFRIDYFNRTLRQIRGVILLGTFLYAISGIVDSFVAPEIMTEFWRIRYIACIPIFLLGYVFTYTSAFERYAQHTMSILLLVAGGGLIAISMKMPPLPSILYIGGLAQVTIFSFVLSRLRFINASAVSWILVVGFYLVSALTWQWELAIVINLITFHVIINVTGMVASYSMEFYVRKNFLQKRTIESRSQELEDKNRELVNKNIELSQSREELMRSTKRAEMIFSALSEALPGTILDDKYRLDERVGSGGFGTVYRAHHLMLNHAVAVKIFKPSFGTDPLKNLERFRLEGISACKIHHPNAVSILDFGVSINSIAYMVMELLQGHPLSEEVTKQKGLSVRRCLEILIPVCSVLAEAHSRDIVHRDIKPSNIFLHQSKDSEVVKVVDFGIAKLMSDTLNPGLESLTETGTFLGTPAYMSPERLSNKPYDGKADVYSIGVMMYEMLCGTQPFQSSKDNYWALVLMHMTHTPPAPRKVNPQIPEKLEAIIMRALEKEPEKRPSAKELETILFSFLQALSRQSSDASTAQVDNREQSVDSNTKIIRLETDTDKTTVIDQTIEMGNN